MTTTKDTETNVVSKPDAPKLDTAELRRLKGIGHELKPVVTVGSKGLSDTVVAEINRALDDHELIKVKIPAGTKEDRDSFTTDLATKTHAQVIQHIGRMALLLKHNPEANPKLSNLVRHSS